MNWLQELPGEINFIPGIYGFRRPGINESRMVYVIEKYRELEFWVKTVELEYCGPYLWPSD